MKNLKRKDLILEHYKLVIKATVIDNVTEKEITVRVHKPKTMGILPAWSMLEMMSNVAHDLFMYHNPKDIRGPKDGSAVWITGNPDWGLWDIQTVIRMDYKHQCVDIYICALLMRPFSQEAQDHYEQRMGFDVWDRMLLMWDSRHFDEEGGYERKHIVSQFNKDWPDYDSLYRVVDEARDIADGTL